MKVAQFFIGAIAYALPDNFYCKLINLRCFLRGRQMRLSKSINNVGYEVVYNDESLRIARRNRFKRYDKGIQNWLQRLAGEYNLQMVPLNKGDCFIDCGANIGELGVWARQFGVYYHAFEPEEIEAQCCDINNFSGGTQTNRKALWFKETELKFYSKPESADSSVIEIEEFSDVTTIEAITLSGYVKRHKIQSIRLLKLEAEGAEPEVLQGAIEVLPVIDYISADCGNERGKEKLPTFKETNKILEANGFELLHSNKARKSYLFRRIGVDG